MPNLITGSASDSLYVQMVDSQIAVSVELHPHIILDLDVNGTVVGIDFQHVTELLAETENEATGIREFQIAASQDAIPPYLERNRVDPGRLVYVPRQAISSA